MRLLPRPLSALSSPREAVRHFTPSWFTLVMSTGIVAQLIGMFPYDFSGRNELGWAFWWLALALLTLFSAMFSARWIRFPRDALLLFTEPTQAMFLGAIPPSLSVIINGLPLFLAPRWGQEAVMEAAVVLWWVSAGLALACTSLLPFFLFTHVHRDYSLEKMTAVWLMPTIPVLVAAGSGGIVAASADLGAAASILPMAFILWGVGAPLCFMILAVYYRRLMVHKLPPKELIVSSFLPVGAMGMGALALLTLGSATVRLYPPPAPADLDATVLGAAAAVYSDPPPSSAVLRQLYEASAAQAALTCCNLTALILWGAGLWWLMVAIYSVISKARVMRFGIACWGFVFPMGVFSATATRLWNHLPGLAAMRVVAAVLICCTILLWCVCMAFTVVRGWDGSLFHAPCLQNRPSKRLLSAKLGGPVAAELMGAAEGDAGDSDSDVESSGGSSRQEHEAEAEAVGSAGRAVEPHRRPSCGGGSALDV